MATDQKHEHPDDDTCIDCVSAIGAILDLDIEDGEEAFDSGFGDMIDSMHNALAAIHRARREQFTDKHDEIANTHEAATELWRVVDAIHRTIDRGRELLGDSESHG